MIELSDRQTTITPSLQFITHLVALFFILVLFGTQSLLAQEQQTQGLKIEEIVVKASWRETKLNQIDGSVLVIDEERLDRQPIKHFEQLSFYIPNLNWAGGSSRPRYFQIRGIGERSGYEGTPNSSVGFVLDDIDFSGQGGIATAFDLEQVEVHRGPQGLRMGANALAGLIYIQSKSPSDSFEGTSEIVVGSDDIASLGLAFGGPVNEDKTLKYRIALKQDEMNGFRENLWLGRDDTSAKKEFTGRVKLNWQPTENTDINVLLLKVDLNNGYDAWTMDGSLNTLSDKPGKDSQDTNALGLKVETSLVRGYRLQSLSSLTHSDILFSYDADWGNDQSWVPYVYDFFSETLRSRRSFNQEFRLISDTADLVNGENTEWVFGLYYLDLNEGNDRVDTGVYDDPFDAWSPYLQNDELTSEYDSENFAVFGNFDYLMTPQMTISLGMRWERWQSSYSDSHGENFSPSDRMMGGRLSLRTQWNDFVNVYASIARGYKSGGFNLGLGFQGGNANKSLVYDPEYLWNYEIGASLVSPKSNLSLDTVLFYSDRKNQQVLISRQLDPNNPTTFSYLTQNAASGRNYGAEFNLQANPSERLSLFASLGLLKTKISRYESRPDLEGRSQGHAPEKTYALGFKWQARENLYVLMDAAGKTSFYYSDSHSQKSESYLLTNFTLGFQRKNWSYEIWIRNVFDRYFAVRGFYFGNQPPYFPDQLFQRQGDPRHMGLLMRYDF